MQTMKICLSDYVNENGYYPELDKQINKLYKVEILNVEQMTPCTSLTDLGEQTFENFKRQGIPLCLNVTYYPSHDFSLWIEEGHYDLPINDENKYIKEFAKLLQEASDMARCWYFDKCEVILYYD